MKIAIIGCPGSGKSTLAARLHKILNISFYHLDQYDWKPG
ncbi:MAG: AAA family ATPase [Candidatus Babeliales bacterium]